MYIIGEKYEKTRRKAVLLTPGYRLSAIRLYNGSVVKTKI